MHTIQNRNLKIAFTSFILFIIPLLSPAQGENASLQLADSLFSDRKYTESYKIYKSIFDENGKASPAMLLKMAYIQEGVKNYADALYYLNIYYYMTFSKRALNKMEELAGKNGLKGYQVTDIEFFRNLVNRYFGSITAVLSTLALALLSYTYYVKRKYRRNPSFPLVAFFIVLLLLGLTVNINQNDRGLLVGDHNYVMEGPSPGSKLIDVAGKGSRIRILGEKGAWMKIRWDDQIAYVRNTDVKRIIL
jgi:hypothetical protein